MNWSKSKRQTTSDWFLKSRLGRRGEDLPEYCVCRSQANENSELIYFQFQADNAKAVVLSDLAALNYPVDSKLAAEFDYSHRAHQFLWAPFVEVLDSSSAIEIEFTRNEDGVLTARAYWESAREHFEDSDLTNPGNLTSLAIANEMIASIHFQADELEKATRAMRRAVSMRRELIEVDSGNQHRFNQWINAKLQTG